MGIAYANGYSGSGNFRTYPDADDVVELPAACESGSLTFGKISRSTNVSCAAIFWRTL
jgi:hypothetical protein